MSNSTRKGTFYNGQCLNILCDKNGPHYHYKNSINTFNVGPSRSYSSNNNVKNIQDKKAILNAYVGINEKRAIKENMKNAVRTWKARNRKSAMQSLKNNRKRRSA
jgi:hypothetical protein